MQKPEQAGQGRQMQARSPAFRLVFLNRMAGNSPRKLTNLYPIVCFKTRKFQREKAEKFLYSLQKRALCKCNSYVLELFGQK